MRIRTQLIASSVVAGVVTLLVLLGLLYVTRESRLLQEERAEAQEVARAVSNMLALTNEYAVQGGNRAATQWRIRLGQLQASVDQAMLRHASPPLDELRRNVAGLASLFEALVAADRDARSDLGRRRRALLIERLLIETQEVVEARHRWVVAMDARQRREQALYTTLMLAAPLALLVVVLTLAVLLGRRVLRPLQRLEEAVTTMRSGDLSARCGIHGADELGDAGRAVDEMAQALQQQRAALQESEHRIRLLADNLPVLIAYIDRDERCTFMNATYRHWLGIEPAAVIGRRLADVSEPDYYEDRVAHLREALAGQRVEFELESLTQDVIRVLHNVYIPDIHDDGTVAGVYALSTDITALKQVEHELSREARVDMLTGLPNRRQCEERITDAMARASRTRRPLALMFLDVDHFKAINDRLGHAAGDAVLKEFAMRLRGAVRVTDMAARLAGDEFVVVLELLSAQDDAELVAAKIVAAMQRPFLVDGALLQVTTSVGVAFCPRPAPDSELLACADRALYEAKAAGRNTYAVRALEPFVTRPAPLEEPAPPADGVPPQGAEAAR